MKFYTIILSFVFSSVTISSWVLPPGDFLTQFALKHNRASITVYLPSKNASRNLIKRNKKSVTIAKNIDHKSKIVCLMALQGGTKRMDGLT